MVRKLIAEEQVALSGVHGKDKKYVNRVSRSLMNTIRVPMENVVACWKIEGIAFEFGGAFVNSASIPAFRQLEQLLKQFPNTLLSLFGHADPVGSDTANKKLSENRARAIYAVLVRDIDTWGDILSVRTLQSSLVEYNLDPGRVDGIWGPRTRDATLLYMNRLCGELVLDKNDFLAKGKCAYQGCSEFNPLKVFSEDMENEFLKNEFASDRDIENLPNRRVVGFLFEKKDDVEPERWPCPAAASGIGGCQKQFWANADVRRKPGLELRQRTRSLVGESEGEQAEIPLELGIVTLENSEPQHQNSNDTFGCRFYEQLARNSPCEIVNDLVFLELCLPISEKVQGEKIRYKLFFGEDERNGFTDEDGWLKEWVPNSALSFTVEWYMTAANEHGESVTKRIVL
ncbi:MAG: hypothetical protein ACI88H_003174 [Cocleimonas sp.]|jgi:hypothetical protein